MNRYLIIAAAVFVGIAIGWIMSRPKPAASDTVLVDEKPKINLIPWVAALAVLLIGLFLIADTHRAPIDADYNPATLSDGELKPGTFNESQK